MSGWLDLTQRGLSPHKKRQASLGALTPQRIVSRPDETVRRCSTPQAGGDVVARQVRCAPNNGGLGPSVRLISRDPLLILGQLICDLPPGRFGSYERVQGWPHARIIIKKASRNTDRRQVIGLSRYSGTTDFAELAIAPRRGFVLRDQVGPLQVAEVLGLHVGVGAKGRARELAAIRAVAVGKEENLINLKLNTST